MFRMASTWRPTTSMVLPPSRSSRVSPTQEMGSRPLSRATLVFFATPSSVSPKYCRRSEWPRITWVQMTSIFPETLAPPMMATNGRWGLSTASWR